MSDPFKEVPLNTKGVYVMGQTSCGCEVYLPVDSQDEKVIQQKKAELVEYLKEEV